MNLPRVEEEPAVFTQRRAVPDPVISSLIPWQQARRFLGELEDWLRLAPEKAQNGEASLRLLVERIPAILDVLWDAHEVLDGRVADRDAELKAHIIEIARAAGRLAAEHAVARILAGSIQLTDAAPKILRTIAQSLEWDVGAFWTLDRDAQVLRCIQVWHAPKADFPAFEEGCRQHAFSPGIGLPGRVWANDGCIWIPDVSQDANFPEAPMAAKEGLHAAVGFPIRNGSEFLGVMEFLSLEIRQPDAELLQMMISIGSHISQFIERMKAEKALFGKEAELAVAKKIQQGLIPKAPPALAGFEIAGASQCADETGGDYFDFFPLLDSCQGIVIADASGHGLGPALVVTETRAYLRALTLTIADIDRMAALLNRRLAEDVGDDYFVTLILARIDPQTRSLHYISAGHPSGCLLDPLGNVKALLKSTGPPLGVLPDSDFPMAPAITLQPGDIVLFLSDGVIETRAPDDTIFGFQRAIDIVRDHRKDSAAQIVDNLYRAVRDFSHNQPQMDDITAVVIKVREVDTDAAKLEKVQKSWLAKAWTWPRKLLTRTISQVKKGYRGLKNRYGPKYSKAILAVSFLTLFLPIPGSWPVGVALIMAVAECHRAISKKDWKKKLSLVNGE
jgi:serine phosphatase RsbU (regulator of sigma subunit)